MHATFDALPYGSPALLHLQQHGVFVGVLRRIHLRIILLLILFLVCVGVLPDHIEVRVLGFESTLRHVGQIRRGLRVVTPPLLYLVLRYLKDTQVLSEVFHGEGVLGWKVFDLFHGKKPCVELRQDFPKLYIVEFL